MKVIQRIQKIAYQEGQSDDNHNTKHHDVHTALNVKDSFLRIVVSMDARKVVSSVSFKRSVVAVDYFALCRGQCIKSQLAVQ